MSRNMQDILYKPKKGEEGGLVVAARCWGKSKQEKIQMNVDGSLL